MNSKLIDALYNIVIQFKWRYMITLLVFLFFGTWITVRFLEPNNEMVRVNAYWWYYLNDIMRSGNSGYQPVTTAGRMVVTLSSAAGSICFFAIVCKTVSQAVELTKRKKKGKSKMNCKDHIVLLGYREGETDSLIQQLAMGKTKETKIVLCTRKLAENPFPELVDFVAGDTCTVEVMQASNINSAKAVVISGHTDERTLMIGILVSKHVGLDCHVVAYFDDKAKANLLKLVSPSIECVMSLRSALLAQAVLHPGSTAFIRDLVDLDRSSASFKINIPTTFVGISFHDLVSKLHLHYGAIPVAYAKNCNVDSPVVLNPPQDTVILGGYAIFYVASGPIDSRVDWSLIN
jgi:Trk K+ transport system NAD-binding subunit